MLSKLFAVALALAALAAHGAPTDPWAPGDIVQPKDVAAQLAAVSARPAIFQVGFRRLYETSHIPGARYAGPCSDEEGVAALRAEAQTLPKDGDVVIYCGCCPWSDCPNIRPAYAALKAAGLRRIRVLSIPTNFRRDWVERGYPVEKGGRK